MSRVFAYVRVSTVGQTVENQIGEIARAGFNIMPRRIIAETVSGSLAAVKRKEFQKLLDRLEPDDVLVVTKLDRLGRDAIDVSTTIKMLSENGVRVHCLQLGGLDLASAAGMMTMNVLNAVAQFERDLLIERTRAGQERARASGKRFGRPPKLSDRQTKAMLADVRGGMTISGASRKYGASRQAISSRLKAASQTATPDDEE